MGEPFLFQIGFLRFEIEQLSKFDFLILQRHVENDTIYKYFPTLIKSAGKYSNYIINEIKDILEKYISFEEYSGLISEFILFNTSKKKKISDIDPSGVIYRDKSQQLTNSQNYLSPEQVRELDFLN